MQQVKYKQMTIMLKRDIQQTIYKMVIWLLLNNPELISMVLLFVVFILLFTQNALLQTGCF